MKKLLLFLALPAWAQLSSVPNYSARPPHQDYIWRSLLGSGAPAMACSQGWTYIDTSNNTFYIGTGTSPCAWHQTGGGSGNVVSGTSPIVWNSGTGDLSCPTCALTTTTVSPDATGGLTGGGDLSTNRTLGLIKSCSDNQLLKYTAADGWICADDNATDTEFAVSLASDTVTIANGKIGIGASVSSITGGTAANPTGTGTVYFYVDSAGTLTAGLGTGVTSAGTLTSITSAAAITAFPDDSFPIAYCTMASDNWVACTSVKENFRRDYPTCGTNMTCTWSSGRVELSASGMHVAGASFDGGGSALSGTTTRCVRVWYAGTITGATMIGDQSGNATVKVKKVGYSSFTGPASASDISNGGLIMTGAVKAEDTTLTGWTTAISAGDVVCFELSSPATLTTLNASVRIE